MTKTVETQTRRRTRLAAGALALAVVLFLSLNVFSGLVLRPLQLDLTENRLFTLSEGTREVLTSLTEPVTLRLYVSDHLIDSSPFLGTYATRVRDLLENYARIAGGKINLEVISPSPFSAEEDRAVGFGLQGITVESNGDAGYFGLAGSNSTDDIDVVPLFSPDREQFLEYDLTRLVHNLAQPKKPLVAMISDLPMNADPRRQFTPWEVMKQIRQFFDVEFLGGDIAAIAPEVDVLMIVHPRDLSPETLRAIDQYVLGGGRLLIFTDPHSEVGAGQQAQQGLPASLNVGSAIEALYSAWGLEMGPDRIVGDARAARRVSFPSGGRTLTVDYLVWLSLLPENFNAGEPVTGQLNVINLSSAGILRPTEGATTRFEPLITSSPESMAIDVDKVRHFPNPAVLLQEFVPGGEGLVMAALVSGSAKSAFPDGPGDDEEAPGGDAGAETEGDGWLSSGPINLIVVADTDVLGDDSWLRQASFLGQRMSYPVADNANFVVNALDKLTGSEALMGLRGRDVSARPFTKVQDIRRRAETQYRATEQELMQKLGDIEKKIRGLEVSEGPEGVTLLLTPEQQKEIEGARLEMIDVRGELREVQFALRQDIENLETRIRFLNVAAMPLLIAIAAVVLAGVQRARFRCHYSAASSQD